MNFATDVVEAQDPHRRALLELARDGGRREWSFGEVSQRSGALAGTLASHGVARGDIVMTLIGNRPEWVLSMVACFRIGAIVLPCTEQLRAGDLRLRIDAVGPKVVIADERNRAVLEQALSGRDDVDVLLIPDDSLFDAAAPPEAADLSPTDPCLITFTSGTAGEPKPVLHAQRYLTGQSLQAQQWLSAKPGELVWCTAASGWSKSARNVFIAPWLLGAAGLLHDARFDTAERLQLLACERVDVLCMAPTEYRMIAGRETLHPLPSLHGLVAAGEALGPDVLRAWREATGLPVRDGYGQTETGQMTGNPADRDPRPGSMGMPLPGVEMQVLDGELVVDPRTVPTFFLGYIGEDVRRSADGSWQVEDRRDGGTWHTGDRVTRDEEGYLFFEGRADDVIISSGYRIGPFEVESALGSHPAVAEAAVVAAPDAERGSIVRAIVVLRDGYPGEPALATELQEHVKRQTAPYKYPRVVEFADVLPKTSSGKIRRALLRGE